jgi:GNAT superfamily N-acetyltransferase
VANPYRDKYGRFSSRANAVQTLGRITVSSNRRARARFVANSTAYTAGAYAPTAGKAAVGAAALVGGAIVLGAAATGARKATTGSRRGVTEYRHSGGGRAVLVHDRPGSAWVGDVYVPRKARGRGHATQLSSRVLRDVDRGQVTLRGQALSHGAGKKLDQRQLERFYRGMGARRSSSPARKGEFVRGPRSPSASSQMRSRSRTTTRTPAVRNTRRRRR